MRRIEYINGQKIGELIFIEEHPSPRTPKRIALFECSCGTIFKAQISSVRLYHTQSCGCLQKQRSRNALLKHGLRDDPIYNKWAIIKRRCYYKKDISYPNYGGRGITICEEWKNDFKAFYDYVTQLTGYGKPGLTLDRKKNNEGYYPGNLRWADGHIQATNQRKYKNNTSGYTGVFYEKNTKKWRSNITIKGSVIHLGMHDTPEEAITERNRYIKNNNLFEYKIQEIQ